MNSKKLAILAIVGLLIIGGTGFGYYTMKMNAPSFKGIAIPVKGVEKEMAETWVKAFQTVLEREDILQTIVDETEYTAKLGVAEDEAKNHLKEAIKVRYKGRNKTIEIGVIGKRKQDEVLAKIGAEIYRAAEKEVAMSEPTFLQFLQARSNQGE